MIERRLFPIILFLAAMLFDWGNYVYVESGGASWYGQYFHGRTTASGTPFDMHALTAAHKTLPLGSVVRVVRRDTGEEITVTINDRGPYIKGRVIDLSYGAARKLNMVEIGKTPVEIYLVR